jgi:hypothetical protein
MANPNRQSIPYTARSEQNVLNTSLDEEFDVLATEGLVYNATTGGLDRATQNSGIIPVPFNRITFSNADTNGNYQTGTVKKAGVTVGTLTLAYDASNNLTDIQFN